jgi:thymidylate kinase
MSGKLIVITGLDGSGTSSLAEQLSARDPGSRVVRTPDSPFDACREVIDLQVRHKSQAAHYLFYLSSVVFASTEIEELLKTGNVYCVRYLIDTVVSHRAAGLNVDLNYDSEFYSIKKPDLTIMIGIDEQVRQERISARVGGKGFLDKLLDDDERRARFHQEFERLAHHYVTIENDASNIEVALTAAMQHMPWIK